jgi:hypothetical protein
MTPRRLVLCGLSLFVFAVLAARAAEETGIEEARGTFETLVEAYINSHGSGGALRLKDPASGRLKALRYLRCDPTTVRQLDGGIFAGEVLLRGADGKKVSAEAVADLRGADWSVTSLEIVKPSSAAKPADAGRVFGAAVLAYVQAAVQRDGAYVIHDDAAGRDRRLRLRMLPSDGLAALDQSHYRSCVFFSDLDNQASVDVDFLVSLRGDSGQVYDARIHGIDGKLRFRYDRANNAVPINGLAGPQSVQ